MNALMANRISTLSEEGVNVSNKICDDDDHEITFKMLPIAGENGKKAPQTSRSGHLEQTARYVRTDDIPSTSRDYHFDWR